jgi:hypothetical protein
VAPLEPPLVATPPRPSPAPAPPVVAPPIAQEPTWSGGPVTWGGDTPAHAQGVAPHAAPPAPSAGNRKRPDALVVEIERPTRATAPAGWFEMPLGPSSRARDDEDDEDEDNEDATTAPAGPSVMSALHAHAMEALTTVRTDRYVAIMAGFAIFIFALILVLFAR